MRAVIYDAENMEPITVIDVPQQFMREIETGKREPVLQFATRPITSIAALDLNRPPPQQTLRVNVVTVRFEPIMKGRERIMWMATTVDGETALLLRSTFLPGQRGAVERERREAFFRGFIAAVA